MIHSQTPGGLRASWPRSMPFKVKQAKTRSCAFKRENICGGLICWEESERLLLVYCSFEGTSQRREDRMVSEGVKGSAGCGDVRGEKDLEEVGQLGDL